MPTILVVDDDRVDREATVRSLGALADVTIVEADGGAGALEAIALRGLDLVVTDLRMPGMDGLQLVEHVREQAPQLPVILVTSQGSEQIAVRALEAGAASYVPKRDLKEHLAETVGHVLEVVQARWSRRQVLRYLDESETRFELENDPDLILPLVGFFQDGMERLGFGTPAARTQVGMALMEAISNAMIHGNLEVASSARERDPEDYRRMIDRRRKEQPFADRRVTCTARESVRRIDYIVQDEGPGFDPATLADPTTPENMERLHGRGLLLIHTFMDAVAFNDRGNRITMSKWAGSGSAPAPGRAA